MEHDSSHQPEHTIHPWIAAEAQGDEALLYLLLQKESLIDSWVKMGGRVGPGNQLDAADHSQMQQINEEILNRQAELGNYTER